MARVSGSLTLERWERYTQGPLALMALAFIAAYVWPPLDPHIDTDLLTTFRWVNLVTWVAFAIDLVVRVALAPQRRQYLLKHWYDVLLVALPVFRPLRALRVVQQIRLLHRGARGSLAGRVLIYTTSATILAVLLGSVSVLQAERGAKGANITNIGDALWWACSTVTTVGYGDVYPVTLQGRIIAVALMVIGIGLVGSVTATVASYVASQAGATPTDKQ